MSKRNILGVTLLSVALVGVAACGGNGVSLGNDGGQAGGGASGGNAAGGKGGTTVLPQGGSSAGGGKAGAGGTSSGGNGGTQAGGAGGTAGSAGTVGAGGTAGMGCSNPKPLDGGWEQCDNGTLHRPTPGSCTFTPSDASLPPSQGQDQCTKDSDCKARPYGYCELIGDFNAPANLCLYGCVADSDCDAGSICVCSGPNAPRQVGTCMGSTNCKSDADCQGGSLCTDYWSQPGCPMRDFGCQTAQDECQSDKDCPTDVLPLCGFQDGHRKCMGIVCQADAP